MSDDPREIQVPVGSGAVSATLTVPPTPGAHDPDAPWATVLIAHGAGGGKDQPALVGLADALADAGVASLRFNFPYREAGRKLPGTAQAAIDTWRAVVDWARPELAGGPLIAAGRSYGARMASMAAASDAGSAHTGGEGAGVTATSDSAPRLAVDGLAFLAYPLHPPGKPDQLRDAHLDQVPQPMLFLQGTTDPFAIPNADLDRVVARLGDRATLEWVDRANHSFEVAGQKREASVIGRDLAPTLIEWMRRLHR
ncbi:MAG TPA: alpha/beta family hydrolase [Candidatus Lumbricidophila sp.]|nr:alpha/beta family hydrolase [Candidatus Lumbricidophila sp.]